MGFTRRLGSLLPVALTLSLGACTTARPPADDVGASIWQDDGAPCGVRRDPDLVGWFARHQAPDGEWSGATFKQRCVGGRCRGPEAGTPPALTTGLVLILILVEGSTPEGGRFRETVRRGVRGLMGLQTAEGWFEPAGDRRTHAIATLALTNAYDVWPDAELGAAAARALAAMADAEPATDARTFAWEALALMRAEVADVPARTRPLRARLNRQIRRHFNPMSCFCHESDGPPIDSARDAAALLTAYVALGTGLSADGDADEIVVSSAREVLEDPESTCLASWALLRTGGGNWRQWCDLLKPEVIDREDPVHGWPAVTDAATGRTMDRVTQTALRCMSIVPYYAYGTTQRARFISPVGAAPGRSADRAR